MGTRRNDTNHSQRKKRQSTTIHKPRHPYENSTNNTPTPSPQTKGGRPKHTTFTTRPINLDLDSAPTGSSEITRHTTNDIEVLLHAPDGRLVAKMTKACLHLFNTLHNHTNDKSTLPEALVELTHIHTTINITHIQIAETKLHKPYKCQP